MVLAPGGSLITCDGSQQEPTHVEPTRLLKARQRHPRLRLDLSLEGGVLLDGRQHVHHLLTLDHLALQFAAQQEHQGNGAEPEQQSHAYGESVSGSGGVV